MIREDFSACSLEMTEVMIWNPEYRNKKHPVFTGALVTE
jgi:hypothetical protein